MTCTYPALEVRWSSRKERWEEMISQDNVSTLAERFKVTLLEDGHVKYEPSSKDNPRWAMTFPHKDRWVVRQYNHSKRYYYTDAFATLSEAEQIAIRWMDTGEFSGIAISINR